MPRAGTRKSRSWTRSGSSATAARLMAHGWTGSGSTSRPSCADGQIIGIGETQLRFAAKSLEEDTPTAGPLPEKPQAEPGPTASSRERSELSQTELLADELTILVNFMSASLEESSHHGLVLRGVRTVHAHTAATVTGFLSLDPVDPLPKMVLPELARVDVHLSRQLTQHAHREGRTIWLRRRTATAWRARRACSPSRTPSACRCARVTNRSGPCTSTRRAAVQRTRGALLRGAGRLPGNCLRRAALPPRPSRPTTRACASTPTADDELIGDSPAMQQLRQPIARMAAGPSTVLVVGESGVGKELVALALHRQSTPARRPAGDRQLRGHRRQLARGRAVRPRQGRLHRRRRRPPRLLRAGRRGHPVPRRDRRAVAGVPGQAAARAGGQGLPARSAARPRSSADVRIVAATNRDLEREVEAARFRAGPVLPAAAMPIRVPPLREHPDDVPALVDHFLAGLCGEYTPASADRGGAGRLQALLLAGQRAAAAARCWKRPWP